MNFTFQHKLIVSIILFIALVAAGVFLHRTGKPYHALPFNIHKLLSVAWIILMGVLLHNHSGIAISQSIHNICVVFALLGILALLFSGGMMSLDRMHETMLKVHRIATGVMMLSVPILVYSLTLNHQ